MRRPTKTLVRFLRGEDGPTAVEAAVMFARVIGARVGAVTPLGDQPGGRESTTGNRFPVGNEPSP